MLTEKFAPIAKPSTRLDSQRALIQRRNRQGFAIHLNVAHFIPEDRLQTLLQNLFSVHVATGQYQQPLAPPG